MIHRASGSHHFHGALAAAVGAHRQTAANHLAHGGEVGGDAKAGLGSAIGDAEAGHHFVEHQQGAVFTGDFPQTFKEAEGEIRKKLQKSELIARVERVLKATRAAAKVEILIPKK